MNDIYREEILDHYHSPRNFGRPDRFTHSSSKNNPLCGDNLSAYADISAGVVKNLHFDGEGCAISIASASILSEYAKGKTKKELLALTSEKVLEILHIHPTPTRLKCALLSLEVLHKMLHEQS